MNCIILRRNVFYIDGFESFVFSANPRGRYHYPFLFKLSCIKKYKIKTQNRMGQTEDGLLAHSCCLSETARFLESMDPPSSTQKQAIYLPTPMGSHSVFCSVPCVFFTYSSILVLFPCACIGSVPSLFNICIEFQDMDVL